jgi:hypothetical protein
MHFVNMRSCSAADLCCVLLAAWYACVQVPGSTTLMQLAAMMMPQHLSALKTLPATALAAAAAAAAKALLAAHHHHTSLRCVGLKAVWLSRQVMCTRSWPSTTPSGELRQQQQQQQQRST